MPSGDIRWLEVYDVLGSSLTRVENVDTTTNRIYDVHYDATTDRLYWSNYLTPPVYSYELSTTPPGFAGLGQSAVSFDVVGGYSMHFEGALLYKVSSVVEVGDLDDGTPVAAWALPGDLGGTVGQNGVSLFRGALLYSTFFGSEVRLIVEDVAALPAHSTLASFQLAPAGRLEAHFVVRTPAPVAVVATAGRPLRVVDLSALPAAPPAPVDVAGDPLAGDVSLGFLDCSAAACFVAGSAGIHVLAP